MLDGQDYMQDQALLKILENPKHNQLGTSYKDKFLSSDVFQWESIARISKSEEEKQKQEIRAEQERLRAIAYFDGLIRENKARRGLT